MSALDELKKKRVMERTALDNAVIFSRHGEVEKAAAELARKDAAIEAARVALTDLKEYYEENNLTRYVHTGRDEENELYTGIRTALAALEAAK